MQQREGVRGFVGSEQNVRQVVMSDRMIGVFLQGQSKFLFGLGKVGRPVIDFAQGEMDSWETRLSFQHFPVLLDCLCRSVAIRVRFCAQGVHLNGVRVQHGESIESLHAKGLVQPGELVPGFGVLGVLPHQCLQLLDGFRFPIDGLKSHRRVVASPAITGVGLQLIIKCLQGLVVLIEPKIREPQVEIDFRVSGGGTQELLEQVNGFRKLELRLVENPQPLEDFRSIGERGQGVLVDLFRPRVIFLLLKLPGLRKSAFQSLRRDLRRSPGGREKEHMAGCQTQHTGLFHQNALCALRVFAVNSGSVLPRRR